MIVSDAIVIIVTWVKTWGTIRIAQRLQVEMCFTSLVLKEGILYFAYVLLTIDLVASPDTVLQHHAFSQRRSDYFQCHAGQQLRFHHTLCERVSFKAFQCNAVC